jgi:hypothetical protein
MIKLFLGEEQCEPAAHTPLFERPLSPPQETQWQTARMPAPGLNCSLAIAGRQGFQVPVKEKPKRWRSQATPLSSTAPSRWIGLQDFGN